MSKGKYGEPWTERNWFVYDNSGLTLLYSNGVNLPPELEKATRRRAIACVNALDGVPDEALEKVRELMGAIGGPDQGIPWLRNIIAKISAVEPLLAPKVTK